MRGKTGFADYLRRIVRRVEKNATTFRLHGLLFGAVNLSLLIINLVTGISFPWFLFPLGGWGIILADHYALLRQHRLQKAEAGGLDELSPFQTDGLRRYHRQRTAFSLTLTTVVCSELFLVMTNIIVSPQFPWAAITAAGLGLTVLGHYLGYTTVRPKLLERIGADLGATGPPAGGIQQRLHRLFGGRGAHLGRTAAGDELRRASELKERVEARLRDVEPVHGKLYAEIGPLLDRYLKQIDALHRRRVEIERLTTREAVAGLEAERARLAAKVESGTSAALESEYRRALSQLDGRLTSLRKLREQREVAVLRLASAVRSLEMLETEVVRLRALSELDEDALSRMIEQKLEELSTYVADFDKGRRELETP